MLRGVDVSNWQGSDIDFTKVKSAGYSVVYIKASEGVGYKDKYVDVNANKCKSANIDFGFYHFFNADDPVKQADKFYNIIKQHSYKLKPVLDVEVNFSGINSAIQKFIRRYRELGGSDLVLYSSSSFLDYLSVSVCSLFGYVWEANYNNKADLTSLPTHASKADCIVVGHQYSDKGKVLGVSGNVDVNVFTEDIYLDLNKKAYLVTDYLPNGYKGDKKFIGVDLDYVLSYMKDSKGNPIRCYAKGDSKGVWLETCLLSKYECIQLSHKLGSWFYKIVDSE